MSVKYLFSMSLFCGCTRHVEKHLITSAITDGSPRKTNDPGFSAGVKVIDLVMGVTGSECRCR